MTTAKAVSHSQNSYWTDIARSDVQSGRLTVENTNLDSAEGLELMPILAANGDVLLDFNNAPEGRSKKRKNGQGLTHQAAARRVRATGYC